MPPRSSRQVDAPLLKALAHPLRIAMLSQLSLYGPATSAQLGRRLGESTGVTSYHLRELAKHGLIEDDPEHSGGGRERWWRFVPQLLTMRGFSFLRDAETRGAAEVVLRELEQGRAERFHRWLAEAESFGQRWMDASQDSMTHFRLNAEQLAAMVGELRAVLDRYLDLAPGEGAEAVEVQINAFPLRAPEEPAPHLEEA
ncbi:ArsR/SmtB family transcription factor [Streptosporangium sp. NPDC000396]|uniref:ArsR/SmtB family transcription factor n=1 Tax=Streptosporangium sp. NPDC000396 TaxID=3366185 RepID=UPI0036CC6AE0